MEDVICPKNNLVELHNVKKIYRTKYIESTVLNNINIKICESEYLSISGPSGCGKSTLLSLLGLMDVPNSGKVIMGGVDTTALSESQRTRYRGNNIGFVFQSFNLIESLDVTKNVLLPLNYARKRIVKEDVEFGNHVLEKVGLENRMKHFPNQLSGGQQQRVAFARALIRKPKLLLADEPTGNLDSESGQMIMELLEDINRSGTTVILVTHDPRFSKCANRNINLFDGAAI